MLAVFISMISYAVFVFVAGGSAYRDASGIVDELATGQFYNCTYRKCDYGLHNSYTVNRIFNHILKIVLLNYYCNILKIR